MSEKYQEEIKKMKEERTGTMIGTWVLMEASRLKGVTSDGN